MIKPRAIMKSWPSLKKWKRDSASRSQPKWGGIVVLLLVLYEFKKDAWRIITFSLLDTGISSQNWKKSNLIKLLTGYQVIVHLKRNFLCMTNRNANEFFCNHHHIACTSNTKLNNFPSYKQLWQENSTNACLKHW